MGPSARMLPIPRLAPHCQHLQYNEKYVDVKPTVLVVRSIWTNLIQPRSSEATEKHCKHSKLSDKTYFSIQIKLINLISLFFI
jgi:hypothetical protein